MEESDRYAVGVVKMMMYGFGRKIEYHSGQHGSEDGKARLWSYFQVISPGEPVALSRDLVFVDDRSLALIWLVTMSPIVSIATEVMGSSRLTA